MKKSEEFDKRCQFVGTLKGDQIINGQPFSNGAVVYTSLEASWSNKIKVSGPLPSIVALYHNISKQAYEKALSIKEDFNFSKSQESFTEIHEIFFDYIESYFASVIFSVTTLEAFCNVHIGDEYEYIVKKNKCIEVYKGEQVERWVSLDVKLSEILPKILGVKIDKSSIIWSNYKELVTVRDRLIHIKNKDRESSDRSQENIWTIVVSEKLLNPFKISADLLIAYYENNDAIPEWIKALKDND